MTEPWSSPTTQERADALTHVVRETYERFNTVEADPWVQLDQLRAQRDEWKATAEVRQGQLECARRWVVALDNRLAEAKDHLTRCFQYSDFHALWSLLDAPLEVEQP